MLVGLGAGCATNRGASPQVACSECNSDVLTDWQPFNQEYGVSRTYWHAHQPDVQWDDCGKCERVLLTSR
jgi:hypothetical protein